MMERMATLQCFSVSTQQSDKEEPNTKFKESRHLEHDFNQRKFVDTFKETFPTTWFNFVCLDYFYCPIGWQRYHLKPLFFNRTLMELVSKGVLKKKGTVFLPFTSHMFREILVAMKDSLSEYFMVSYLEKHDLDKNMLWNLVKTYGRLYTLRDRNCWERPYQHDSTASRPLSEVKHVRAWLVLRWGTTLESQVLFSFWSFSKSLFPFLKSYRRQTKAFPDGFGPILVLL
jgi:hypothetical protein